MDLSILIPARNEQWLKPTIADVLKSRRAQTEIIVVCDGAWPVEPLDQHPDVHLVYLPTSRGQRAATNIAAKLSNAPFVMKADAHVSFAEGFDVALIEAAGELGDDVVQIPRQYHLHVFNWKCLGCGTETYQGPTPTMCAACAAKGTPGGPFERVMLWERRQNRWRTSTDTPKGSHIYSDAWHFDSTLHFGYFGAFKDRPEAKADLSDTMSCLGACWFLSRARYWELGGLDEAHGSWGQMGTELACKSWLSGGRMVTNKRTSYAHLFRTQGADFGFPYPLSNQDVEAARAHSRSLWLHDAWSQQVRPLRWLLEKFAPVPGWTAEQIAALPAELRRAA